MVLAVKRNEVYIFFPLYLGVLSCCGFTSAFMYTKYILRKEKYMEPRHRRCFYRLFYYSGFLSLIMNNVCILFYALHFVLLWNLGNERVLCFILLFEEHLCINNLPLLFKVFLLRIFLKRSYLKRISYFKISLLIWFFKCSF